MAVLQGTPEWFEQRRGKVTASRIADLMAKTKSGYSTSRQNYLMQLLCERLTGKVEEGYKSTAMQRGNDLEAEARNWYQYDPFIRANFLAEEVGEVSRAIRTLEIGRDRPDEQEGLPEEKLANLTEELGDVLDNLFILADKYDISLETIMQKHKEKLLSRYQMNHMTEKNS